MPAQNSTITATKAAKKAVPGKPFSKGQSGNPGGRPLLPDSFKAKGPKALSTLVTLMASDDEAIALKAAQSVADRCYGKAVQAIEADVSGEINLLQVLEKAAERVRNNA